MILETLWENSQHINVSLTICELFLLKYWIDNNIDTSGDTQINVLRNGCDAHDYYHVQIMFEDHNKPDYAEENIKRIKQIVAFIKSLSQYSNFGGIRENEYWIDETDVGLKIELRKKDEQ